MSLKRWVMRDHSNPGNITEEYGIHPVLADILCARGVTGAELKDFLEQGGLESPFALKDMDVAVERIQQAIDEQEKIAVYGDYDCDGITSTVLLVNYLEAMGADVQYSVPEREEGGYGLNKEAVDLLHKQNVKLIITVDNGITAVQEAEYISNLGMDLVITDHHSVGDTIPKAVAVVNPHRDDCPSQFKDLAGAGVAFKLVAALEGGDYDGAMQFAGDFAAIGTIGDVMPLTGENRTIVRHGLEMLKFSENVGLNALMDEAKISRDKLNATTVAFGIAPRINAAGRFSKANKVAELLLCEDEQRAANIAREIEGFNNKRKQIEQDILQDIHEEISKNPQKLCQRVLVFAKQDWPLGVLGTACSKIKEQTGKPVVLLSIKNGEAVGSARSVEGFSIYDALYQSRGLMTKWGGHALAAGMTLAECDISLLDLGLNEYAKENMGRMPDQCIYIDRQLDLDEVSMEMVQSFSALEPCGNCNPSPVFMIRAVKLEEIVPLSGGAHLKLKLSRGGQIIYGLLFGTKQEEFFYRQGTVLDVLVTLDINNFNGNSSVSIKIKDIRPHAFEQNKYFNAKLAWERAMCGEDLDKEVRSRLIPERKDFAAVYQLLCKEQVFNGNLDKLYMAIHESGLNYGKLALIVEVLQEHGLVECSDDRIRICQSQEKVDIFDSQILQSIKQG